MKLSIIVPIRNEAVILPDLITHLSPLAAAGIELIAVDGCSDDGSAELLENWPGRLIRSTPGRAGQMNMGASVASGEVLLFLHADTRFSSNVLDTLRLHWRPGKPLWGRFDVSISGRARMLAVVAFMMNLRSRATGIATGDQAIFMSRALFDAVGGFPDQALMEDVEMSARLRRISRPVCLRERVQTSGRRWEQRGVWRTIGLMWRLRWAYWRGAAPDDLARAYR